MTHIKPTKAMTLQCFGSLTATIAFSPKDWSLRKEDAWIYGITLGWDDASLRELQQKFNWPDSEIERLKGLHNQFVELTTFGELTP